MGYATYEFYTDVFHGSPIPATKFQRLIDDASEILDNIVQRPISATDAETGKLQRAACYQTEMLFSAGGMSGLNDAAVNGAVTSETLDDHTVSRSVIQGASSLSTQNQPTSGGIPVSTMAVAILRQMGYLNRCAYAGRLCPHDN
ncbi:MAG: hypothetical protein RR301_11800 [Clostridia bacterium]